MSSDRAHARHVEPFDLAETLARWNQAARLPAREADPRLDRVPAPRDPHADARVFLARVERRLDVLFPEAKRRATLQHFLDRIVRTVEATRPRAPGAPAAPSAVPPPRDSDGTVEDAVFALEDIAEALLGVEQLERHG